MFIELLEFFEFFRKYIGELGFDFDYFIDNRCSMIGSLFMVLFF